MVSCDACMRTTDKPMKIGGLNFCIHCTVVEIEVAKSKWEETHNKHWSHLLGTDCRNCSLNPELPFTYHYRYYSIGNHDGSITRKFKCLLCGTTKTITDVDPWEML